MNLDFHKVYDLQNIYECSLIENPVVIRKVIAAKDRWKTYELVYDVNVQLSNEKVLTIPADFRWDLSSVPRVFWSILPPDGDFIIAALIHDWLYVEKEKTLNWFDGNNWKARKFADKEMLKWSLVMHKGGYLDWRTYDNYIRYVGVRLFGWFVWRADSSKIKLMNAFLLKSE